jgi:hypothetical protein
VGYAFGPCTLYLVSFVLSYGTNEPGLLWSSGCGYGGGSYAGGRVAGKTLGVLGENSNIVTTTVTSKSCVLVDI